MTKLKTIELKDAKPESQELLKTVEKKFGFIPQLMLKLADSPVVLQAYLSLADLMNHSLFSPVEQQAILLAVSVENQCDYCVAAHSLIADKMASMPATHLESLRSGMDLADSKLNELVKFTREIVQNRGVVNADSLDDFFKAGYNNQHVLEVLLGVTMKTLSNYTNHLGHTEVDPAFSLYKWTKK